ncbi:MAG: hypothetical protein WC910_07730 [Bacteroidales bacterium]|jgi:hypothetical protein
MTLPELLENLWPFSDDEPDWVKARHERDRMIEELVIENAPDILKMPEGYSFVYGIPAKTECRSGASGYPNGSVIEYVQYRLAVKRGWLGPTLGYHVRITTPSKKMRGFDFNDLYITERFEALYRHEGDLEKWKVELAQQLPDFFAQLRLDINLRRRASVYEENPKQEVNR